MEKARFSLVQLVKQTTSYAQHMFFKGTVSHLVLTGHLFQRLQYGPKDYPLFLEEDFPQFKPPF